jgi:hypothetical protein
LRGTKIERECPKVKRSVGAVIVLILAVIAATVVYPRYRAARELAEKKKGIAQALAKDAAFTETLLKMELEATGATYKELFGFCDKSIDQRNALIVEMRVNTAILAPNTSAAILDFLNAENGFARAKSAFFSASLEYEAAVQAHKQAWAEFQAVLATVGEWVKHGNVERAEASLAESDVYVRAAPRLIARVKEAAQSTAASISSLRAACESLVLKEKKLASEMSTSGMPFRPVFAPYYKRSIDKANEDEKKTKV